MLRAVPCKICGAASALHGVVDFNRSCEIARGMRLPLLGVPVWYYRCGDCRFLFTAQFDDFTDDEWRRHVYNDGYASVDPDSGGTRASANAVLVKSVSHSLGIIGDGRPAIMIERSRTLDYGSGGGELSSLVAEPALEAAAWDPFQPGERPTGLFDLVTSFEVFEHTTRPIETAKDALGFVRPGGALLFSTLTCDELADQSMDWWYIAPRNGHVSIHSTRSLALLFGGLGWGITSLSPGVHLAAAI
jgi:hypothetical protein